MKYLGLVLAILLSSNAALAAKPTCSVASSGYCQYIGPVRQVYVNSGNLILLTFDVGIDPADAAIAGFTPSRGDAAAYPVDENPEFGKLLYSTMLTAQASKRQVTIQMRGTSSGYLKIDRIWMVE